jgi:hypothetical protein
MSEESNTENTPTEATTPTPEGGKVTPPAQENATDSKQDVDNASTTADSNSETKVETTEAPEQKTVEYNFKFPEGVEPEEEVISAFKELGKKHGLSQEAAQEVVDFQLGIEQKSQEEFKQALENVKQQWLDQSKKDPEFGGPKYEENMGFIAKAMKQYGTPELKQVLEDAAMANHPEIVRLLYRVGVAMSEDKVSGGAAGAGQKETSTNPFQQAARMMYPSMRKQE